MTIFFIALGIVLLIVIGCAIYLAAEVNGKLQSAIKKGTHQWHF